MKVKEYLNMEQEILISYLTLREADQGLVDPFIYSNIYEYFLEENKRATHMLTYTNESDILSNELYVLVDENIDEIDIDSLNYITKLRVNYEANKLILTINIRQLFNNIEHDIVFDLKDKQVSLSISQLLKQKDIEVHFISKNGNEIIKLRSVNIYIPRKMKTKIIDFLEIFLNYYNIKTNEVMDNLDDILIKTQAEYVRIPISREDIEKENVLKYEKMLNSLYPNVLLTHTLCEKLDIVIDGYEEDPRELWQIPEVRAFIEKISSEFKQWFYFLDKSSESLYWITMCLCAKGFSNEEKYKTNTLVFNDFLNEQLKNLGELSYYLNEHETFEKVKENVFNYYKHFKSL